MKKQMISFLLFSVFIFGFSSCTEDKKVSQEELPQEVKTYISTHFPDKKINQVVVDDDLIAKSYDVFLEGNVTLEFDGNHNATDINSTTKLPDSVVPATILEYVKSNYPNNFIIGLEIDDNDQQVKLDNLIELEFDSNGQFIKIDS